MWEARMVGSPRIVFDCGGGVVIVIVDVIVGWIIGGGGVGGGLMIKVVAVGERHRGPRGGSPDFPACLEIIGLERIRAAKAICPMWLLLVIWLAIHPVSTCPAIRHQPCVCRRLHSWLDFLLLCGSSGRGGENVGSIRVVIVISSLQGVIAMIGAFG